jgi:hypothetical protein
VRKALLTVVFSMLVAPAAIAQTGKHLAIGASLGFAKYLDKDFDSSNPTIGPAYRVSLKTDPKDGWSWSLKSGFGWSRRKTTTEIGGERTDHGRLQTILIMGGIQRVFRQGPWQAGVGIVAGPSINKFDVDAAARDAYQSRLGLTLDDIKVKNSLAVRPGASVWYDLNEWLGVEGALSYTFNRPKAETTVDGATTSSTWKTDHASASVGLVVGLF